MDTNAIQENNYMVNDLAAQSHQEHYPGEVIRADELDGHRFLFSCQNGVRLLLHVLSDKILRFRYLTDGPLSPDFLLRRARRRRHRAWPRRWSSSARSPTTTASPPSASSALCRRKA